MSDANDKRLCARPGMDPDDWFRKPNSVTTMRAKGVCMNCELYFPCQEFALAEGIPEGVFGGLDGRDRDRLWRRTGGKPTNFLDAIDDNTRPLLQEVRDLLNFDKNADRSKVPA